MNDMEDKMRELRTGMTLKQRKFCDEFLISGNATQAAKKAGYEPKYASMQGSQCLKKENVRTYIDLKLQALESKKIAKEKEVLEYLTSVMRDESDSDEMVIEGKGEGKSEARTMRIKPPEKDRIKAAELLGKRYGLWTEKIDAKLDTDINITIDYTGDEEDTAEDA